MVAVSLNIKAVENPDECIDGVVRMISDQSGVYGICVKFSANGDREIVEYKGENPFFYGHTGHLRKNYGKVIPPGVGLGYFVDKQYAEGTRDHGGDPDIGFLYIPVESMRLPTAQELCVRSTVVLAEEVLPELVPKLEKVKVYTFDYDLMRAFGHRFAPFPIHLRDAALEIGFFYSLVLDKRLKID